MEKIEQAVLKTLAYRSVFNYPLTLKGVRRWLITDRTPALDKIASALNNLVKQEILGRQQGYYFLAGEENSIAQRQIKVKESLVKLGLARQVFSKISFLPTVKVVALTGAVAAGNAAADDDIDIMVICAQNSLWITRLILVLWLNIVGRRRKPKDKSYKDKICLNLFLDTTKLFLADGKRSLYSAYEILQARPLIDKNHSWLDFLKANDWIIKFIKPEYQRQLKKYRRQKSQQKGLLPSRLSLAVLSALFLLEPIAYLGQRVYMRNKKTTELVSRQQAFFHPQDASLWVMAKYKKRLKESGLKI